MDVPARPLASSVPRTAPAVASRRQPTSLWPRASAQDHAVGQPLRAPDRVRARDLVDDGEPVECSACGSRAIASIPMTRCAFCGSSRLRITTGHQRVVAPRAVLPFAIDRTAAAEAVRRFVLARWLAPADLRHDHLPHPTALYLPYWAYEVHAIAHYRGRRGDDDPAAPRGGSRARRRTHWRPVSGTLRLHPPPLQLSASQLVPARLVDALPPLDPAGQQPYCPTRLRGTVIERHAIEPAEALRIADGRLERELRAAVRREIGGDAQRIHDLRIEPEHVRFEQILRPVWITAYRHRERVYRVLVDGHTGAVIGERPWSPGTLAAWVLAVVVALVALGSLVAALA